LAAGLTGCGLAARVAVGRQARVMGSIEMLAAEEGIPAAPHLGSPHWRRVDIEYPEWSPAGLPFYLQQQLPLDRQQDIPSGSAVRVASSRGAEPPARIHITRAAAIVRRFHRRSAGCPLSTIAPL
jgi:hypothetical protein